MIAVVRMSESRGCAIAKISGCRLPRGRFSEIKRFVYKYNPDERNA